MKYAFCGGKLLDGTREMQPREGLVLRSKLWKRIGCDGKKDESAAGGCE